MPLRSPLADGDGSSLGSSVSQKHFSLWCHGLIYTTVHRRSPAEESRWSFSQFLSSPSGIWVTEFQHTSWPPSGLKAKSWLDVGGARGRGAIKSEDWFKWAEREAPRGWNPLKMAEVRWSCWSHPPWLGSVTLVSLMFSSRRLPQTGLIHVFVRSQAGQSGSTSTGQAWRQIPKMGPKRVLALILLLFAHK